MEMVVEEPKRLSASFSCARPGSAAYNSQNRAGDYAGEEMSEDEVRGEAEELGLEKIK
jgi:hypothetical protein